MGQGYFFLAGWVSPLLSFVPTPKNFKDSLKKDVLKALTV